VSRPSAGRVAAVVLGILAVANAAVWGGALVLFRPAERTAAASVTIAEPSPSPVPDGPPPLPAVAVAEGVVIRSVSADTVAVAFHEASYHDAVPMRPLGRCGVCRNRTKFRPPPPRDPDLEYIVTDSRGRDTAATSAVDLVLRRGAEVVSPVDGVLTRVRRYRLYARYPDVRVEIRPLGVPDRRVVMLHLARVDLRRGDRVEASVTRLGVVRRFPFRSQVDRYVRGRYPHVHLEVKDPAASRTTTRS
jgi:hypothetical protein